MKNSKELINIKHTYQSRRNRKITKIKNVNLLIDYDNIDEKDVYGLYLSNRTSKNNIKRLPDIGSFVDEYPDFLALDTEYSLFAKTPNTGVCFFIDDSKFDTIDGLYNAIIYKDIELLKYYKQRFSGV